MFRHLEAPIKNRRSKTGNTADSEPVRRDCSLEINVSIDFHILHSGTESRACKHAHSTCSCSGSRHPAFNRQILNHCIIQHSEEAEGSILADSSRDSEIGYGVATAIEHALECRACICKTIISISHLLRSSNRLPQRHPQAAML